MDTCIGETNTRDLLKKLNEEFKSNKKSKVTK